MLIKIIECYGITSHGDIDDMYSTFCVFVDSELRNTFRFGHNAQRLVDALVAANPEATVECWKERQDYRTMPMPHGSKPIGEPEREFVSRSTPEDRK